MTETEPLRRPRRILRPRVLLPVAAVFVGLAVFVLVYFQPQKLFIDDKVNDTVPADATPAVDEAEATSFTGLAHSTSGQVTVLTTDDGSLILRMVDLRTDNGPDLKVYLSTTAPDGDDDTFDDEFISLGALRGNIGSQNYAIPAGTDLSAFSSVVIWCDRFDVAFGAAALPSL